MTFWEALCENRLLLSALAGWAAAQLIKTILFLLTERRLDFSRLFGDGGMPSGHSATVTALAVGSALLYGAASFEFAVTSMLAIIVMHDAMGVRQEAGRHAKLLNSWLAQTSERPKGAPVEEFKELIGHTPLQVVCGALVGLASALFICG